LNKIIEFFLAVINSDSLGELAVRTVEGADDSGATTAFTGTATTAVQSIPATADKVISSVTFAVDGKNVQISADNEESFFNVPDKSMGSKDIRGGIRQIQIKTSSGSTDFDFWIDFKEH